VLEREGIRMNCSKGMNMDTKFLSAAMALIPSNTAH